MSWNDWNANSFQFSAIEDDHGRGEVQRSAVKYYSIKMQAYQPLSWRVSLSPVVIIPTVMGLAPQIAFITQKFTHMCRRPQMVQQSNYITALQPPFHLWNDWFWGGWGWSGGDWFLHPRVSSLSPVSSYYSMQISFSLSLCRMVMGSSKLFGTICPPLEQLQGAGVLNLKFTVWVIYTHSENKNRQEKETERKSHWVLPEQQKASMWIFHNSHAGKIWQHSQCTEIIKAWHS